MNVGSDPLHDGTCC